MLAALAVMVLGPVVSILIIISVHAFAVEPTGPVGMILGFAVLIGVCAPLPALGVAIGKLVRLIRFRGYRRELRGFLAKYNRLNAF